MDALVQFADAWAAPWPSMQPYYDLVNQVHVPLITVPLYLAVIFGGQAVMKNFKAFELKYVLAAHNFFLCAWSLVMTLGVTWTVYKGVKQYGALGPYCGVPGTVMDDSIVFWANMFYISKYYELFDTVFLFLRKKPLTFLHVYHHCFVIFCCWYAVDQRILMGFITTFNNASIHVFMYFYYGLRQLGIFPWWRKLLTTGQIIQFMSDCLTSLPYPYLKLYLGMECSGTISAWLLANAGGISFYILFTQFYNSQYRQPANTKKQE